MPLNGKRKKRMNNEVITLVNVVTRKDKDVLLFIYHGGS